MTNYKLSEKLLNEVLSYLGKRPYGEVYQILDALRTSVVKLEETTAQSGVVNEEGSKKESQAV